LEKSESPGDAKSVSPDKSPLMVVLLSRHPKDIPEEIDESPSPQPTGGTNAEPFYDIYQLLNEHALP
jgi:hypothetical protein